MYFRSGRAQHIKEVQEDEEGEYRESEREKERERERERARARREITNYKQETRINRERRDNPPLEALRC